MNNQQKEKMKEFNLTTKRRCFFIKGITALSLSFALQGKRCTSGGGTMDHMVKKINDNAFMREIENRNDISQEDEVHNNLLYAAVSSNNLQKVVLLLNRIDKDIKSGFRYKEKDFPNIYNKKSKKTALGLAIEENYIPIVRRLAQSEHIDINKAKIGSTSLLEALFHKKKEIAKILLDHPKIDICTKDAISGSSPLHLAIEQKLEDTALLLIPKLSYQDFKEKNKKGEIPLHLAIEHNLKEVITVLVRGLSSIEDLCQKDNKGRSPLHMAVRDNNQTAFKLLLDKIWILCHNKNPFVDSNQLFAQLFDKDIKGRSVFARSYLPKYTTQGWVHITDNNVNMFEYVLKTVGEVAHLNGSQWEAIIEEINKFAHQGTIKEQYADRLRKIVDTYRGAKNAVGAGSVASV